MAQTIRTGPRQCVAQGGAAIFGCAGWHEVMTGKAAAQEAMPSPATPTPNIAVPAAARADHGLAAAHPAAFDRLAREAWNDQDRDLFRALHTDDVKVAGCGLQTERTEAYVAWANMFLAQNPESTVEAHPIRIAAGDWSSATGLTGSRFSMANIARWEDGRIAEEYLYRLEV